MRDEMRGRLREHIVVGTGLACLVAQFARSLIVEHPERGWDVRFQRKARKEILAERMNGLYLEAARRLKCFRKQAPRFLQALCIAWRCADVGNALRQIRIVRHRPLAELLEQPPSHLCCCGFCVGEAENMLGLCLCEQQPCHAIG